MSPLHPSLYRDIVRETRARAQREHEAASRLYQGNESKGRPPHALTRVGRRIIAQRHMADALKIAQSQTGVTLSMLQARLKRATTLVPLADVEHTLARCRYDLEVALLRVRALHEILGDTPQTPTQHPTDSQPTE